MLRSFYFLLRPLVFLLDPERAHEWSRPFLSFLSRLPIKKKSQPVEFLGKTLFSPVGFAAGFDKEGKLFPALPAFGFSFVETGTFTPLPQPGNPRPRIRRFPRERALVNKMGFNNPGIVAGWESIRQRLNKLSDGSFIAVSLGKGKETPLEKATDDYLFSIQHIEENISDIEREKILYLAVNISSPNTPGLRQLQESSYIVKLVKTVVRASSFPVFVKVAPDFHEDDFVRVLRDIRKGGAAGVIVHNTSIDYDLLGEKSPLARDFGGGVSGEPLRTKSRHLLSQAREVLGADYPIVSSGGIMDPEEIAERIKMGASLVQVYTGFIYYGPSLVLDFLVKSY